MARVRFYYDVYVDEDDIRENLELDENTDVSDEDIIDRAKTLFGYDIQDRDINVSELDCEIVEW